MLNITNQKGTNKYTVRYYLTPIRMTTIKKAKIRSTGENVEKWNPVHCWRE